MLFTIKKILFFFCTIDWICSSLIWYLILQIIQQLKKKQKALQARLERPAYNTRNSPSKFKIAPSEKRKNPFLE